MPTPLEYRGQFPVRAVTQEEGRTNADHGSRLPIANCHVERKENLIKPVM